MKKVTTTTANKKATTSKATKPRKKSSLLTAKSKANDKFKEDVFSLSGLVRYAKNEGAERLQNYIEETNKAKDVQISLNRLLNTKHILSLTKERELSNRDGSMRLKWSYWHLLNVVGREAKRLKGIEWNTDKAEPKTVKQVKRSKANKAA